MSHIAFTTTIFAQAYGSGTYGCGAYQIGCATTSTPTTGTVPGAPNTGMALMEPSFVIPGAMVGAVIIALATTTIARAIRRARRQNTPKL